MLNAYLSHSGKLFANVNICSFIYAAARLNQQGRNKGSRGRNFRAANLWGRRMIAVTAKDPNNVTRTFFNTVHWLSKDLRFENGGVKFASWHGHHLPRYPPINLEISSVKKPIHSLLCCTTAMKALLNALQCNADKLQTHKLHWRYPWNCLFVLIWRLVKSWVSNKFSTLHSDYYCCLSFFLWGMSSDIKDQPCKKQTISIQHSSK